MPPESWDRRIRRAEQLTSENGPARSLLRFDVRLLRLQKQMYDSFCRERPSGVLEDDVALLRARGRSLLREVAEHGPEPLAGEARGLLADETSLSSALLTYWRERSDRQFFAKALLQPYAQRLVECGAAPWKRAPGAAANRCPHCGGMPQLSILEAVGGSGDGSGRLLMCATCLTPWPFRRLLCPSCGEEREEKLGYFQSPAYDHVRVDACESCHRYLKSIDLGRFGLAVPLVDEVAAAPLDVWARDHGYDKIELNLVGL